MSDFHNEILVNHSKLPWSYQPKCPPVGITSSSPLPPLFQELKIRNLTLKNRIVVSPMCQYSSTDGYLNDWHLVHLGQFAIGGASLVIQEATAVQAHGRISPFDAGLWKDDQMVMMKRIVDFIHSQHAAAGIQLGHAGRKASTKPPFDPTHREKAYFEREEGGWPDEVVAPSSLPWTEGWIIPKELSLDEIEQFKNDFICSTKRAIQCGFDFLEIHAAHGYLLAEFLSQTSNHRQDKYGGSFENRIRLLLELTERVRQVWPEEKPLSVRLSCDEWVGNDGWTIDDTLILTEKLLDLGVDIIDTSSGGNSSKQVIKVGLGYQVPFADAIKKKFGTKILAAPVGMIVDPKQADDIIEKGQGDLIVIAREFLRDSHFPLKAAKQLGVDISWAPQYQRAKQ
ncbi:unnamed protein product [Didymodactylos carnosus]|uniref:NADH:flavin oxidoreductase/NADH oxidase N-terminal domain-containing protein n=1 Tax=Didymodactylos carnosus TaxID=1234261 RepID=A0A8S2DY68_9BILA|nr:unnamed protein product [Didymodactylos carnosus]CAF3782006.1 unnamed protein product [Didymodactylos carnosus]